jgi:hypothetical protein
MVAASPSGPHLCAGLSAALEPQSCSLPGGGVEKGIPKPLRYPFKQIVAPSGLALWACAAEVNTGGSIWPTSRAGDFMLDRQAARESKLKRLSIFSHERHVAFLDPRYSTVAVPNFDGVASA